MPVLVPPDRGFMFDQTGNIRPIDDTRHLLAYTHVIEPTVSCDYDVGGLLTRPVPRRANVASPIVDCWMPFTACLL